jgi:branched-chain amino acid transport system substrate-binding protein
MKKFILLLVTMLSICTAKADINIGVILSLTGPGAALGQPEEKVFEMWTEPLAGQKVHFTILNDNSDPATAASTAMRLIAEHKVDLIIGSSLTPPSMAITEIAGAERVPMISLAGGGSIVNPMTGNRKWAFKLTPTESQSTNIAMKHMQKNGVKTIAIISVANSFGETFRKNIEELAPNYNIKVVAQEKYATTDQSATAQVLKVMEAKPDAVYIVAMGAPALLPELDMIHRGYKGPFYQVQGAVSSDFLRIGGKDVEETTFFSVAPVVVGDQLPSSSIFRKVSTEFLKKSDATVGVEHRTPFAATVWDALLIVDEASKSALKVAKPGTPEFRSALRDSLENVKNHVGTEGVYNMTPEDHNGLDDRSQVLIKISNGKWVFVQ